MTQIKPYSIFKKLILTSLMTTVGSSQLMASSFFHAIDTAPLGLNYSSTVTELPYISDDHIRELVGSLEEVSLKISGLKRSISHLTQTRDHAFLKIDASRDLIETSSGTLERLKDIPKSKKIITHKTIFDLVSSKLETQHKTRAFLSAKVRKKTAEEDLLGFEKVFKESEETLEEKQPKLEQLQQEQEELLQRYEGISSERITEFQKTLEAERETKAAEEKAAFLVAQKEKAIIEAEKEFALLSLEEADILATPLLNELRFTMLELEIDRNDGTFTMKIAGKKVKVPTASPQKVRNDRCHFYFNETKTLLIMDVNDRLAFIKLDPQSPPVLKISGSKATLSRKALSPMAVNLSHEDQRIRELILFFEGYGHKEADLEQEAASLAKSIEKYTKNFFEADESRVSVSRLLLEVGVKKLMDTQKKIHQLKQEKERLQAEYLSFPQSQINASERMLADPKIRQIMTAETVFSQLSSTEADQRSKRMLEGLPVRELEMSLLSEKSFYVKIGGRSFTIDDGGYGNIGGVKVKVRFNTSKTLIVIDVNNQLAFIKHDPKTLGNPTFKVYKGFSSLKRDPLEFEDFPVEKEEIVSKDQRISKDITFLQSHERNMSRLEKKITRYQAKTDNTSAIVLRHLMTSKEEREKRFNGLCEELGHEKVDEIVKSIRDKKLEKESMREALNNARQSHIDKSQK